VPGHIRERGRPLLGAALPDPGQLRLVHADRLDRADPLGIVDQQLTVGRHRVVDGMPVTAQRDHWLADALRPERLRPPPSNEGRSGGGEALGGPEVMATACTLGLMSHFSHQMGAAAEPRVRPVAPM
jgi:hypothetical protein